MPTLKHGACTMDKFSLLAIDPNFNPDNYTSDLEDEVIRLFTQSAELAFLNGKLQLGIEVGGIDELGRIGEKLLSFSHANFSEVLFLDKNGNIIDRFTLSAIAQFPRLRSLVG